MRRRTPSHQIDCSFFLMGLSFKATADTFRGRPLDLFGVRSTSDLFAASVLIRVASVII